MKPLLVLSTAALLLVTGLPSVRAIQDGTEVKPDKTDLKPGEYTWNPRASEEGALSIVASLGQQMLVVYRDGVPIGRSTISTGTKGHETPPDIYMIVQKQVTHHSNKYHEASMPYMERLTWSGLAIHAGNTPGYPESHGCIHVPEDFAKQLYGITQEGDSVLVAQGSTEPQATSDPNLFLAGTEASAKEAIPAPSVAPGGEPPSAWDAQKVASGSYRVVFNSADKRVTVFRKGVEIGHADLGNVGKSFGEHLYVATTQNPTDGGPRWSLLANGDTSPAPDLKSLADSLTLPAEFRQHLREISKAGTTLVLTDRPADKANPAEGDDDKED